MPDQEYRIRISSSAELSALKETETRLMKQVTIARTLGQDYSKAARELAAVQKRLGEFGGGSKLKEALSTGLGRIPVLGELMSAGGGAAGAGLAAVGIGLKGIAHSVQEFSQAEDAVAGLDAALAQSGQLTEDNRVKMQDLAGQLQSTTAIADEKWTAVIAKLVQFGSKTEDIEKNTEAVKNLAGIMGGDLESAAMMVAKAMQGNYQAFSRLGIQIDDSLSPTEKLAKLYEELANRGAGQLEARAKTLSGQWETLKNNTSDLWEAMGRGVSQTGIIQSVLFGLGETAATLARVFGGVVPAVGGLTNAATNSKRPLEDASKAAGELAEKIKGIETNSKAADDQLQDLIETIGRTKSEEQQIADSHKALELAMVNDKEKRGAIGPVSAAAQRRDIENKYAQQSEDRERKAINDEIALRQKAISGRRGDVQTADSGVAGAQADLKKSKEWQEGREGYMRAENRKKVIEAELYGESQNKERRAMLNHNLTIAMREAERLKKFSTEDPPPGTLSVEQASENLKAREARKAKIVGLSYDQNTADERAIEQLRDREGFVVRKSARDRMATGISGQTSVFETMKKEEDERKQAEQETQQKKIQIEQQRGKGGRGRDTSSVSTAVDGFSSENLAFMKDLVSQFDGLKKEIATLRKQTRYNTPLS